MRREGRRGERRGGRGGCESEGRSGSYRVPLRKLKAFATRKIRKMYLLLLDS